MLASTAPLPPSLRSGSRGARLLPRLPRETSRAANSGAGAAEKLSWVADRFVRNATKFREVHRAKRLALREPERSAGIRRSIEATAESIAGAPTGADPEQVKATAAGAPQAQASSRSEGDV
jgi:hypothetical protein